MVFWDRVGAASWSGAHHTAAGGSGSGVGQEIPAGLVFSGEFNFCKDVDASPTTPPGKVSSMQSSTLWFDGVRCCSHMSLTTAAHETRAVGPRLLALTPSTPSPHWHRLREGRTSTNRPAMIVPSSRPLRLLIRTARIRLAGSIATVMTVAGTSTMKIRDVPTTVASPTQT